MLSSCWLTKPVEAFRVTWIAVLGWWATSKWEKRRSELVFAKIQALVASLIYIMSKVMHGKFLADFPGNFQESSRENQNFPQLIYWVCMLQAIILQTFVVIVEEKLYLPRIMLDNIFIWHGSRALSIFLIGPKRNVACHSESKAATRMGPIYKHVNDLNKYNWGLLSSKNRISITIKSYFCVWVWIF